MEVPEIGEDCRGDEFDGIARHVTACGDEANNEKAATTTGVNESKRGH